VRSDRDELAFPVRDLDLRRGPALHRVEVDNLVSDDDRVVDEHGLQEPHAVVPE
jgi:hypothetical protein